MVYGKFKKDTTKTVGVSKKIVSIGNGDYDGDKKTCLVTFLITGSPLELHNTTYTPKGTYSVILL